MVAAMNEILVCPDFGSNYGNENMIRFLGLQSKLGNILLMFRRS